MARATYLNGAKRSFTLLTCPATMGRSFHLSFRTLSSSGTGPPTSSAVQVNQGNSGAYHRRFPANRVRGATSFGSFDI